MIRLVTGLSTFLLLLTACGNKPASIEEFESMAQEVEQLAASIAAQQQEIRAILQSYNQTVPAAHRLRLDIDPVYGLGEAALGALSECIDRETDESCRSLLERIAEIQDEIAREQEMHMRHQKLLMPYGAKHASVGENEQIVIGEEFNRLEIK